MDDFIKTIDATGFEKDKVYLIKVLLRDRFPKDTVVSLQHHLKDMFDEHGIKVILYDGNCFDIEACEIQNGECSQSNHS